MLTSITTKRYNDHIAVFIGAWNKDPSQAHNLYIGCYHESVTLESVLEDVLENLRDDV